MKCIFGGSKKNDKDLFWHISHNLNGPEIICVKTLMEYS